MTFGEAINDGFSKYATFSGRSSRPAYWWWFLFGLLVAIGANILDRILGTTSVIAGLAALALFLPGLAVLVRRFHDAGHSGWWVLILFVPVVGWIVWLIFALTDSAPPNRWGDGPDTPPRRMPLGQMPPPPPPQGQPVEQTPPPPPPQGQPVEQTPPPPPQEPPTPGGSEAPPRGAWPP